jgi:hypothetical protein
MSYLNWFNEHAAKHRKIIDKLLEQQYTQEQIIQYFDFDNMVIHENAFCPLYAQNKKCHDMESLNCYLCACPYFRFKDSGITTIGTGTQFSLCSIASKDGKQARYGDAIHQDCSACTIPHTSTFAHKHFNLDWKAMMLESPI